MSRDTAVDARQPTVAEQQQMWDWHWRNWRERKAINAWTRRRGDTILEIIASLGLDRPRILDLGCGQGWFSHDLSRLGEVTGIDLSEAAIAEAKATYPGIRFLAGSVMEVGLPPEHFDVAVSQEVLAHVDDQAKYLQTAADVLRPGGYLIVTTANKFVMDRLGVAIEDPWPREHIENFLDRRGLRRLLLANFDVLRMTSIIPLGHAGALRLVNSPRLNGALRLVIPGRMLERLKERAGLGYTLIAVARRKRLA